MLDFRTDAGLELLGFVQQVAPVRVLVQRPTFNRSHVDMPVHARGFWSLDCTLLTGVRKHHNFLTMQQAMTLRDIFDIGSCADGL